MFFCNILSFLTFQCSYDEFLENVFTELTSHNIIFVKLFQALSSNNHVSERTLSNFRKCVNSAQYYENDIDYEIIDHITSKYDIKLESTKPINSGMIALVFKGRMATGEMVAIKVKRRNVYNKLLQGYNEFVWWFTIFRNIFPYIGLGDVLESVSSFVDSKDYIMTQCNFQEEIHSCNLFRGLIKEMTDIGVVTCIDRIVIPKIYNHDADNEFIIMEFLDGKICFDVDEKIQYLETLITFGLSTLYIYHITHTDLHPGNIICMKDGKMGIIDFGMHLKADARLMDAFGEISKLVIGINKSHREYFKYARYVFDPLPDVSLYTEEQIKCLDEVCEKLFAELLQGKLTEKSIRKYKSTMDVAVPQLSVSKFNADMVKILLSNTMVNATCFHFTKDVDIIYKIQQRVIREVFS